jgi:hypothetical protein
MATTRAPCIGAFVLNGRSDKQRALREQHLCRYKQEEEEDFFHGD